MERTVGLTLMVDTLSQHDVNEAQQYSGKNRSVAAIKSHFCRKNR